MANKDEKKVISTMDKFTKKYSKKSKKNRNKK